MDCSNEIAVEIFNMSNSLPKSEDYALTSQIEGLQKVFLQIYPKLLEDIM
jgi:hypothetical protein